MKSLRIEGLEAEHEEDNEGLFAAVVGGWRGSCSPLYVHQSTATPPTGFRQN